MKSLTDSHFTSFTIGIPRAKTPQRIIGSWLANMKPNTAKTYSNAVKSFFSFQDVNIEDDTEVLECIKSTEIDTIRAWMKVKGEGKSGKSIHTYYHALSALYDEFVEENIILKNPWKSKRIMKPKKDVGGVREYQEISDAEVRTLLDSFDRRYKAGLRMATMMGIFFGGGLRCNEVCELTLGDIGTTSTGQLYLRLKNTKANKDQRQPMPEWASKDIRAYLKLREREGGKKGDYLFSSIRDNNKRITNKQVWYMFKKAFRQAGLAPKYSPHSARATTITKLLRNVSTDEAMLFSRHSSIQALKVYDKRRISLEENPGLKLKY